MSSSPFGTTPATRRDSTPRRRKPASSQATCFAGPPTLSRAMMRTTFISQFSVIQPEDRFGVVLVALFVNLFESARAFVEAAREVDGDPRAPADASGEAWLSPGRVAPQ